MRLHLRTAGDHPRIAVLIHGGMVSGRIWQRTSDHLVERGYRVIAPDLRGHGLSPRGLYSIEDWAEDLVECVPSGAELVVGHSLGATIMALAVERLSPRRAVFAEPGFEHDVKSPEYFAQMRRRLATMTTDRLRAANPLWSAEDARRYAAGVAQVDPDVLDAVAELCRTRRHYVPARAVVPSLLLTSASGSVVRPETADLLGTRGFEVRTVPGTGHCLQLDDPDAFVEALDGWL